MRPVLLVCLAFTAALTAAAQPRPVTFEELMRFRTIEHAVFSDSGGVLAFTAQPDRGEPTGVVRVTTGDAAYDLPRASHPALDPEGRWAAFRLNAPLAVQERARRDKKDAPEPGLLLLDVRTGRVDTLARAVGRYAFSPAGGLLAYGGAAPDTLDQAGVPDSLRLKPSKKQRVGKRLVLRPLDGGAEQTIPFVHDFAFSENGRWLAFTVAHPDSARDGLFVWDARDPGAAPRPLDTRPNGVYGPLAWSKTDELAFVAATEDADGEAGAGALFTWNGDGSARLRVPADTARGAWRIPLKTRLDWTDDGQRLFFGLRPQTDESPKDTTVAPLDPAAILRSRTVDVWHVDDPRIVPQQKVRWKGEQERTYRAVLHPDGRVVRVEAPELAMPEIPQNPGVALVRDDAPYRRETTWDDAYADLALVSLDTGARTTITRRLAGPAFLSPDGAQVVYYADSTWYGYAVAGGVQRDLTAGLAAAFADEQNDVPAPAGAYGFGGWVDGGASALLYSHYDVWQVPLAGGRAALRLTDGEPQRIRYRVEQTDPEQRSYTSGERLLLSSFDEASRASGFYRAHAGRPGAAPLYTADARLRFVHRAKKAPVLFYTEETFRRFPDLWRADADFSNRRRLTDVNPQTDSLRWGSAEIVSWRSADGTPLDGILYKPDHYDPSRKYPVLVYFYERLSEGLYNFAPVAVSHRPAYPLYLSDDYLVFLPDVVYEVGRPGLSAVKSIVPGVQQLIEMGIADPARIGIHGHSWGGYESAFLVTQTNLFRAASTGAPVSNMTSAYGGIRWGSGLARQFQYEQTQSRLGASLWEGRDRFIENSPLFYADRIHTPLLIFHGDADGSVPWYQSIELYLALRRLGRPAVFLQYRGEDHHPAQYANKLDWAMRMKQWFDHYLRGLPGPDWIEKGAPYREAGD